MTLLQNVREKFNAINNNITKLLVKNVDEETGEIDENVLDELNGLELKKEELVKIIGASHFAYRSLSESIENDPVVLEAKRKLELAKKYKATSDSFKKLLLKVVPEGQIIENEEFRISWRKSSTVETDDFDFDIDELERTNPELVKVTKTLNKAEIKKLNVLPKGIQIVKKQNLQIK